VPAAFADAQDAALKAEFAQTNGAAIAALKSYLDWLKSDLLPRSTVISASALSILEET